MGNDLRGDGTLRVDVESEDSLLCTAYGCIGDAEHDGGDDGDLFNSLFGGGLEGFRGVDTAVWPDVWWLISIMTLRGPREISDGRWSV